MNIVENYKYLIINTLTMFWGMILLISCEEVIDYEKEINKDFEASLVVYSWITDREEPQRVELTQTRSVGEVENTTEYALGADVSISDGTNTWALTELDSGIYETDSSWFGIPGATYTLDINWNNNSYSAKAKMAVPGDFEPFQVFTAEELGWPPEDVERFKDKRVIPFLNNLFGYDEAARWDLVFMLPDSIIDYWASQGVILPEESAPQTYYTHPNLETSGLLSLEAVDNKIVPIGTKLRQTKYGLTEEHYEFLRALLSETDWKGNIFESIPGNISTNLNHGAYGYFGASATREKIVVAD